MSEWLLPPEMRMGKEEKEKMRRELELALKRRRAEEHMEEMMGPGREKRNQELRKELEPILRKAWDRLQAERGEGERGVL